MPNKVEIVVTSTNKAKPGAQAARRDVESEVSKVKAHVDRTGRESSESFSRHGGTSGKGFLTSLKGAVASGASGVAGSFSAMAQKAGMSPQVMAAGAAVGMALMSAVGGAIIAGGATMGAGLGVAIVSGRPEVKQAAGDLVETVSATMREAAGPMVAPVLGSLNRLRQWVENNKSKFGELFEASRTSLSHLTDGLLGMVDGALPGFISMIKQSEPVMRGLSAAATDVGKGLGTMFKLIGAGAEGGGFALRVLGKVVQGLAVTVGSLIYVFELQAKVTKNVGEAMFGATKASSRLGDGMGYTTTQSNALTRAQTNMGLETKKNFTTFKQVSAANRDLKDSTQDSANAVEHQGEVAHKTSQFMRDLQAAVMDMASAQIDMEEAIDDATKSIKDNGKTLDINTEKGRANKRALIGIAESALEAADSAKEAGKSQDTLNGILGRGYTAFVKAARGAGMSKTAADKLARSYGLLPAVKTTRVRAQGADSARRAVNRLRDAINAIPGSRTVYINVQTAMDYGSNFFNQKYTGGVVGAAASGGVRSGLTRVAEHGRELLKLPPGTQVMSNPDTERYLDQWNQGKSPSQVIELKLTSDNSMAAQFVAELIRKVVKVEGRGSVQAALGKV